MLNIVLIEPEIPQNTGNIARTCACVGARLHLVEPMGFRLTQRNLARAGCDYWDEVEIVRWPCVEEFLEAHIDEWLHADSQACSDEWRHTNTQTHSDEWRLADAQAQSKERSHAKATLHPDAKAPRRAHFFTGQAKRSYADIAFGPGDFLLFGRESAGIDPVILQRFADNCVRIPMREGLRSLNLSNAVAIATYEALRQQGFTALV